MKQTKHRKFKDLPNPLASPDFYTPMKIIDGTGNGYIFYAKEFRGEVNFAAKIEHGEATELYAVGDVCRVLKPKRYAGRTCSIEKFGCTDIADKEDDDRLHIRFTDTGRTRRAWIDELELAAE